MSYLFERPRKGAFFFAFDKDAQASYKKQQNTRPALLMRSPLLLALALLPAIGTAEVYKWTDAQGRVHYGDQPPTPKAQPLDLPPPQAIERAPALAAPAATATDAAQPGSQPAQAAQVRYETLAITFPQKDAAIRDNAGNVAVQLSVSPPLQTQLGHRFALSLDGNTVATGADPVLRLENVDRGTHTLQAAITDDGGRTLATSEPVTFHLLRAFIRR